MTDLCRNGQIILPKHLMGGLDTPQIDLLKGKELHPDGQAVKGTCRQKSA